MNDDDAIHSIHKKIEREKALINAANSMRAQTNNEAVRSRLDSQMRDGRRNLQFFEEKLRDIQMRRVNAGVGDMSLGGPSDDAGGPPAPPPKDSREDRGSYGSGSGQYAQSGAGSDLMPPRHPYAPGPGGSGIPKPRPNFTKLGASLLCHPHRNFPETFRVFCTVLT
jgi:classical protein kinase C